jgi:hypothetical protein
MKTFGRFLGVGALALLISAGTFADTLELKDGRTLRGRYLGGTQVIVRFEVDGDVQTFRVTEISAVNFDRRSHRNDRRDDGAPPPRDQSGPPPNGQYDPPPPDQSRPNDNQGTYDQSGRSDDQRPYDQGRPNDNPPSGPRDRDSRRQPVYAASGTTVTIPEGQTLLIRMIDGVDSRDNAVGDGFHASLETDIVVDNILVARRGSDIYGRLSFAKEAGHLSGSSELQLELTRLLIDGREFPITTGEYTVRGKGRGGDTAKKVGTGAVAGAIIGAIAGGGQGAAIGAGVGSAAGAGVQLATRGREVRVPSETLLEFRLEQPVKVTPTQQ